MAPMQLEGGALKAKFLLLLAMVTLSVAGMECGLRWLGFRPAVVAGNEHFNPESRHGWAGPDIVAGWRNKVTVANSTEPGNVPMTFWSDGRRASRSHSSISALPQVAILGCSYTQGYGVVDEETFPYRMSSLQPGWDFENFGTGGYGAYQSLLTLKRITTSTEGKYAPKLVVYGYADFHARRDVAVSDWVLTFRNSRGEHFAPPHVLPGAAGLIEHEFEVFPLLPLEAASALVAAAKKAYIRLKFSNRERYEDEVTRTLLAQMRDVAAKNGARLLIMGLTRPGKSAGAFLRSEELEFLNCADLDPNLDLTDSSFKVGGVGHPNAKAHESWASCLSNWMDAHEHAVFNQ